MEKTMKCKACGQELSIDKATGIGVCVGCNKKYKVSTIVKPKICSVCNVPLEQNGAIWECPTCGKKYVFSNNKNKPTLRESTQKSPNEEQKKTETDWKEDLLNESFGDDDAILPQENNAQPQDSDESNQENKTDVEAESNLEQPSDDTADTIIDDDVILSQTNDNIEDDAILDDAHINENIDNDVILDDAPTNETVDNDVILDDAPTNESIEENNILDNEIVDDKIETPASIDDKETSTTSSSIDTISDDIIVTEPEKAEVSADENVAPTNNFDVARVVEIDNQIKPTVSEMPLLYDDDGSVFQNGNAQKNEVTVPNSNVGVRTLSQIAIPKNQTQAKAKNKSVGAITIAVILGIISTLAGIGCYVVSILQNLKVATEMNHLFATIQNVAALVFFAVFAVICFTASAKPIGAKKVGTILGGIFAVAMIARRLLTMFITSGVVFDILAKNGNIITYCIYAVCIFASFLTMVITCKTDFHKKATMAGVIFFVFSLLSLLTVALRMLPLDNLNLSILEIIIPFTIELEILLLAFGAMGLLSVIAKPKE